MHPFGDLWWAVVAQSNVYSMGDTGQNPTTNKKQETTKQQQKSKSKIKIKKQKAKIFSRQKQHAHQRPTLHNMSIIDNL